MVAPAAEYVPAPHHVAAQPVPVRGGGGGGGGGVVDVAASGHTAVAGADGVDTGAAVDRQGGGGAVENTAATTFDGREELEKVLKAAGCANMLTKFLKEQMDILAIALAEDKHFENMKVCIGLLCVRFCVLLVSYSIPLLTFSSRSVCGYVLLLWV